MLKTLKNDGFASLTEVIITAVIFTIAAFGLLAAASFLRPEGRDSARKLEAAYVGKSIMDSLRQHVDAATWMDGNSLLASGVNYSVSVPHSSGSFNYTVDYYLEDVPGTSMRQLFMTVTYPDG